MNAGIDQAESPTFLLLGPMSIRVAGVVTPCGTTKQESILARLLLEPNEYVAMDEIKDAIWGRAAVTSELLHVYASRLRRPTGPFGVDIQNTSQSYRIVIDEDRIDLHRFRALARETPTDPDRARQVLDQALALCQGAELLTDMKGEWLEPYRRAHAVAWHDVLLRRNRVWLDKGLHEELVMELRPIIAGHFDDERLAEDYLLALYRSGRLGEALAHYISLHKFVRREQGRSLSTQLQTLNSRMIGQDPGLDFGAVASGPPPAPAILAPAPSALIGRDADLGALRSRLTVTASRSVTVLAISGPPTIGKTSLAVEFAHRIKDTYPGGCLQANFEGSRPGGAVSSGQVLTEFLIALGVTPARIPAEADLKLALYRHEIAHRKLLVLLDDVASEHDVAVLMPHAPGSLVLVTTRRRLPGLAARYQAPPIVLGPLSDASGAALLAQFIGADRADAEPDARDRIVRACAGMPLALCLAGAYLAYRPAEMLADVAAALADRRDRIAVLDRDTEGGDAISTLFQWSYARLPEDQARMFRMLGISPCESLDVEAAAALADIDVTTAGTILTALADAHLVSRLGGDRYAMLDLIASYAATLASIVHTGGARAAALDRLSSHFTAVARAAGDRLWLTGEANLDAIFEGDHDAAAWLETQRTALLDVAREARGQGRPADTIELSRVLARYLDHGGFVAEALELHGAAVDAALTVGDRTGRAFSLTQLAAALVRNVDYDAATAALDEALTIYTELGDARGMGIALGNMGRVASRLGRLHAARDLHLRSAECLRSADHRLGVARALTNLGAVYVGLGDLDAALATHEEALAICRTLPAPDALARACASIAGVHQLAGRLTEAATLYEQALTVFRSIMDRTGIATTQTNLGALAAELKRFHDAVALHEEALAMFDVLADRANAVEVTNNLGFALLGCGRSGDARLRFAQALAGAEATGLRKEIARAHAGLAESYEALGAAGAATVGIAASGDPDPLRRHLVLAFDLYAELDLRIPTRLQALADRTHISGV